MVRLKIWQWGVLLLPLLLIVSFFIIAAGAQIHDWGLSWIWAVVVLAMAGWRWLLVRWTQPEINQLQAAIAELEADLETDQTTLQESPGNLPQQQAAAAVEAILDAARSDPPVWEDWNCLMTRCHEVIAAVARAYHPEVKYPLLNIYVPDAYRLLRGTVDEVDAWMEKLSPVLGQVSIGQAVQAYEMYRQWEPSARRLWRVWSWTQWLVNPIAATARLLSEPSTQQANQQLLANLNQLLREVTLQQLQYQAIALYSGETPPLTAPEPPLPSPKTETLQHILEQAQPIEPVTQRPLDILLVGRTGAGKSSLINTLFNAEKADVDLLPSTDAFKSYQWRVDEECALTLWDAPGYEQADQTQFREQVIDRSRQADLLLLVTPALDPALQVDADLLAAIRKEVADLEAIAIVTQVDRLRPVREWQPPYNWQSGDRPKEISIREAVRYRQQQLGGYCALALPIVAADFQRNRLSWNIAAVSQALVNRVGPTQQLRLSRFLRDRQAKINAAARIIDRYSTQMSTAQGLTALLKSPVLQFLSTLTTGSPALARVLIQQIPVEQVPVVIGKLQLAYDVFQLFAEEPDSSIRFDLLKLWPAMLAYNHLAPDQSAWALGHALVEIWSQREGLDQLNHRLEAYLDRFEENAPEMTRHST